MMNNETEIWKEVKSFEGRFWISNLGRLKSHDLRKNTIKILPCYIDICGYYQATLRKKPLKRKVRIHTLVAEHFCNMPIIEGTPVVNHIDGNKLNNHFTNLEWISHRGNSEHAVATGLHNLKGTNHPLSKLTETDIIEIRRLYPALNHKEIAQLYGMNRRQIGDIINRVAWKHVA